MKAPECSGERQRVDDRRKRYLPRLAPAAYQGFAAVHWTLTIEDRQNGWLTPHFLSIFQLVLLHACTRYGIAAPVFVLMPDHLHLLTLGLARAADSRLAIHFLRKHLALAIAPACWQSQVHDHVLRNEERNRDAFVTIAHYIQQNPVRAGFVERAEDYPFMAGCVPGYPELDARQEDYWERFWRCYRFLVERSR